VQDAMMASHLFERAPEGLLYLRMYREHVVRACVGVCVCVVYMLCARACCEIVTMARQLTSTTRSSAFSSARRERRSTIL
jgi:hypothetical protein